MISRSSSADRLHWTRSIPESFGGATAIDVRLRHRVSFASVRKLEIERTQLLLSVAARTFVHADCENASPSESLDIVRQAARSVRAVGFSARMD
jgi:hypothetical protein